MTRFFLLPLGLLLLIGTLLRGRELTLAGPAGEPDALPAPSPAPAFEYLASGSSILLRVHGVSDGELVGVLGEETVVLPPLPTTLSGGALGFATDAELLAADWWLSTDGRSVALGAPVAI